MTIKKAKTKATAPDDPNNLRIKTTPNETQARRLAETALDPSAHAAVTAIFYNKGTLGSQGITETYEALVEQAKAVQSGDLSNQQAMLAGQANALNSIFTELARRAGNNMGEHLHATQLYMRLALKAQAQCRSTIEALDRLANGHVQTVKHVHVGDGGQAVIADQFHHHAGGQENAESTEQPHATGAAGASPALPSPDPFGNGVPIASREGQPAMQDARRQR